VLPSFNNLIVANSIVAGGGTGGNISGANNISANTITLGTGYGGNISGANIISANTVNVATSLIFPDGTIQYTANGSGDTYARGAITSANANIALLQAYSNQANANIAYTLGVDLSQNTTIQAAFNKANTGVKATASNTRPTGNTVGDLWLSLTDSTVYIYSYDGVSNNWVDISGPILISSNILVQYSVTANVS
jgi:hypothetical protein